MNQNYYTISFAPNEPANASMSNWKYRQYMQRNANELMKSNTYQAFNDSGTNPYYYYTTPSNVSNANIPFLYNSTHQPVTFHRNSDLQEDYMKQHQMKARKVAPSIAI